MPSVKRVWEWLGSGCFLRVHSTYIMTMTQRSEITGITFRAILFQLIDDKNTEGQSEAILLWRDQAFEAFQHAYNKQKDIMHWCGHYSYGYNYHSCCEQAFRPQNPGPLIESSAQLYSVRSESPVNITTLLSFSCNYTRGQRDNAVQPWITVDWIDGREREGGIE